MQFRCALFALALAAAASEPGKQFTALERLTESRLEAVHQARLKWARERIAYPPLGLYRDFRAILHVHAEDAEHTLGTREQVLEGAHQSGVEIIMWTDHQGPRVESWTGYRQGVLFIPGAEGDHELVYPSPNGDLKFLSHLEEAPEKSAEGYTGMEIYNRHTDAKLHAGLTAYLQEALKDHRKFRKLASLRSRYPDEVYAAGTDALPDFLARYDGEIAKHRFTAIAANDAHRNQVFNGVVFDPYDVAFRFVSTHILARELLEPQIRQSLRDGRAYVAHDWLCDPAGFSFVGTNNLGLFELGDRVPLIASTRLFARFPIPAHIKLIHNARVVAENTGGDLTFTPKEEGAYRIEAWLTVAGEERPWIYSNPLYLYKPDPAELALPSTDLSPNVQAIPNQTYAEGKPEDAPKHQLDLYLPSGKTKFPVLFFVHGGSWRTGDRSSYVALGNRFAKLGIGVVIPSYRLAPANPHPAQIDDVAAAFAWTVQHIASYGGDPARIYAAGHSAGGHLVSLLALDPRYLAKFDLTPHAIQGVMSLSGVYDVRQVDVFGPDEKTRRTASPQEHITAKAPPFLVTYCQWDYPWLPAQALNFDRLLRRHFVSSSLRFIPNENHISEIIHIVRDGDTTAHEMLKFMDALP